MTETSSSQWYKGVETRDLIVLIEEAKERADLTPDAEERQLWVERLKGMQEELLSRQESQEQIEV